MPEDERLVAPVYLRSELGATDIREMGMGLINAGFEPVGSDSYRIEYNTTGRRRDDREVAALPTASEAIAESEKGALFFSYDGFNFECNINYKDDIGKPDIHLYGLEGAFAKHDVPDADRKRRAEVVVDAIEAVAEITDPWGVMSMWHGEGVSHHMPSSPPAEVSMGRLPWLIVFGPEWCDHLGGRDRLLGTPAWNTRELTTGAVFVRKTELSHENYRTNGVRDTRVEVAPADYVFEGWTTADPDELREQMLATDPRTHLDPFRALDDGGYGEDICHCKGHASIVEETAETDYRGLLEEDLSLRDRCQVLKVQRRGDALWLPKTDQFLRRLVDDDGIPLGDRPDDVPPEHEMLSLTILLDAQRENPPSWYEIEEPGGRSVATKLNRFISRSPSKSIWEERDPDEE